MKWEYMLLDTSKPLLSLTEGDDSEMSEMNDEDDVENLVSLRREGAGEGGGGDPTPSLASGQPDTCLQHVCVCVWRR